MRLCFSCDEVALRDLPSTIDHILATTGREKLLYMGHSMGTTVYFILCDKLPHYCNKIDATALLAPVAYAPQSFIVPAIGLLVEWSDIIVELLRKEHIYEFLGQDQRFINLTHQSCLYGGILCTIVMEALATAPRNKTLIHPISEFFEATLAGSSVKVAEHLGIILSRNGYFGPLKPQNNGLNNMLTNPSEVEEYNIDIDLPVAIFWSLDDTFVDKPSIDKLIPKLKNLVLHQIISPPFTHMGFFYEIKANYGIVKNILSVFSKYDSSKRRS